MMKSSSSLTLYELMSSNVLSITPRQTLGDAAQFMSREHASCLIVLEDLQPVGILTERDIVRLFHERVVLDTEVAEVMSCPLLTVSPSLDFHSAYSLLQHHQVRHLVVVEENGEIAGVVSETDFRSHLEHSLLQRIRNLSSVIDRGFPSLSPADSLNLAVERMAIDRWDYVMVVEAHRALGIVTERDVPRLLASCNDPGNISLREVMSSPVRTISIGASVIEADALMTAGHLRHLAVIDERQQIVGVISQHRLMEYLGLEILDKPARQQKALNAEKNRLESRLQLVLDKTGIGIWEYDHHLDQCYWSDSLCNLLGYAAPPNTMRDWLDCLHPADRTYVEQQVSAALANDNLLYEAEYRMRRMDGEWLWFYSRGKIFERDKAGAPLFTAGTMTDISQRKHAELLIRIQHDFSEKLALSPNRVVLQRAILESALRLPELDGGGLYWLQSDGGYLLIEHSGFSDTFIERVSRLPANSERTELIRRGALQTSCCPACDQCGDPTLKISPEVAAEGIHALVVLPIMVGGKAVACLNLASKHSALIGPAAVTALDTLTRQFSQALEHLAAREQAQSRERDLRDLFGVIKDYLFILDMDARILHYNQAVAVELGYGQSLLGQSVLQVHPPEVHEMAGKVIEDMLAGKRVSCPLPLLKADGSRIFVDTRVVLGHWDGHPAMIGISRDISEQVRQHEALQTEKHILSDILNSLPGIFYMFDANGRFLRWNRQFSIVTGYSDDVLANMGGADFFEGEDKNRIALAMKSVFEYGAASIEADIYTSRGQSIPYYFSGLRTVIDGQAHLIGLGIDITEERITKRELANERTRLKTLVETIPDLVWLKDINGVYLACNPMFERLFGAKEKDIVGKSDYDFVSAELADFFRAHDKTAIDAGAPTTNEEWLTFADDGHRALFETIKTPMRDGKEHVVGVLGIARDITDIHKAHEALNEANLFLRESQRIARVGGWKANPVANLIIWTEEIYRLVEHPLDRPPADLEEALSYYAPESLPRIKGYLLAAWECGTPFTLETEMISASGRCFWAELRCVGKIEQEGGVFLTGTFQDITERRKIEEDIRRLNESLEQRVVEEVAKNREKDLLLIQQSRLATMGEMMHNVAHQWRQPLNTLNLIIQNIQDAFRYGELDAAYLSEVAETGNRVAQKMSRTIDDFRNFFRSDASIGSVNLAESTNEALRLVEAGFAANQISVTVEMPADIRGIGYANEFSQVLLNILINAKDAIKAQHSEGLITVRGEVVEGFARIRVCDNGGGIPEDVLPKIFDPYFTTKESGTGIGLYMSRMIMKHMGGNIEARNIEEGAEVSISLPTAPGTSTPLVG